MDEFMNIRDYIVGTLRQEYQYKSFVPSFINQTFTWDCKVESLLEIWYNHLLLVKELWSMVKHTPRDRGRPFGIWFDNRRHLGTQIKAP